MAALTSYNALFSRMESILIKKVVVLTKMKTKSYLDMKLSLFGNERRGIIV